jgi:hypothetical protein
LIGGVAAEEQAVEKSRLALREVEIVDGFGRSELWHGGHKKNAVYPKARPRQVGLEFLCYVPGNPDSGDALVRSASESMRDRTIASSI